MKKQLVAMSMLDLYAIAVAKAVGGAGERARKHEEAGREVHEAGLFLFLDLNEIEALKELLANAEDPELTPLKEELAKPGYLFEPMGQG